jgi:hypothetical protein
MQRKFRDFAELSFPKKTEKITKPEGTQVNQKTKYYILQ